MTDLRDQLQASLGDDYVIERELGGGGMSHVFVVEEKSLGRRIVVKVLPADLSGSVSTARFRREVSLAARLQHPHIVPLLAAGEVDRLPYYTMPFVDGESLRARLQHGEMPIAEVISILRDVARALAYAHDKGVAHRDIKPDNVLLTGASAVIADFGIAKAVSDAAVTGSLTSIGVALGTPAYMSPEQAAADPATDFRADIYSFGAMAYEMLAGRPPFAGRTMQATIAAHLTEAPQSISELRPTTPASLAQLVMRCLEKNPDNRPQSASEMVRVLDTVVLTDGSVQSTSAPRIGAPARSSRPPITIVAGVAVIILICVLAAVALWRTRSSAPAEVRSIAVLPFENASGDTTYDYLEDGITDRVRDALNAVPELTVKARSSSRQLKGRDVREIGSKLAVDAVLQGTVSRSSSHLHVTAELVRAADNAALWSNTFDGQPDELAGIQDKIADAVASKLRVHSGSTDPNRGGPRDARGARGTSNIEAYDRYLQGLYAFGRLDWGRAAQLFNEAVARDPRFARAHGYLAMSYANAPTIGLGSLDSLNALALASARSALAIDSTVAEAYAAQAFVMMSDMHFAEGVEPLGKAVSLDPANVDVVASYALTLGQVGRVAEALEQGQRAAERDPLSGSAHGILSYLFEMARRYHEAITSIRAGLDLDPTNVIMYQALGFYFAFDNMPDSAVRAFETAVRLNPALYEGRAGLVFGYAAAGRWKDAERERTLLEREVGGDFPEYRRTMVHLAFGEFDAAMTSLEKAVRSREPIVGMKSIACDPLFDPLKNYPRYEALMRRVGARSCPAKGKWPVVGQQPTRR
jgi:serine/threonine protein kinase/tetratricopeptide (TPR) repeat protein